MKQFLITSPLFTGEAKIIYDEYGILQAIDTTDTDMPPDWRRYLFRNMPLYEHGMEHDHPEGHALSIAEFGQKLKSAQIIESDFEVSLDDFIREYPYKRNTHLLPDIWKKMSKSEQVKAVFAAKAYRKYCERNKSWYKPKIAAAWLQKKEYLNNWKAL